MGHLVAVHVTDVTEVMNQPGRLISIQNWSKTQNTLPNL
jgi:hypothetical protein